MLSIHLWERKESRGTQRLTQVWLSDVYQTVTGLYEDLVEEDYPIMSDIRKN